MTIDWTLFVPALALLWYPADKLMSRTTQLRTFESFRNLENSPGDLGWWRVPLLWLDPVRSFAGTLLLQRAFRLIPAGPEIIKLPAYWVLLGILLVAIVAQTITRRGEDAVLAPIGFLVGLIAALLPWSVVLIGSAMGIAALFAFRRFHAFFTVGPITIGLLGFFFGIEPLWLIPAVVLLGAPCILALLTGRLMELPARRRATAPPFVPPPR